MEAFPGDCEEENEIWTNALRKIKNHEKCP